MEDKLVYTLRYKRFYVEDKLVYALNIIYIEWLALLVVIVDDGIFTKRV